MQESLATEHGSELLADTLEEFLDGSRVAHEGGRHLETLGRDRAEGGLDVVRNPFDKVRRVLALDVAHLVLDLLHGDLTTAKKEEIVSTSWGPPSKLPEEYRNLQNGRARQITAVTEVRGSHHVLGVEHLLRQLGNGDSTERVSAAAGQGSEADHEEVETREGHHVDSKLAEVRVELARETERNRDAGHDGRHQVVEVAIRRVGQLQRAHADVVEGLVVNTEGLVGVLDELVDGEGGVVGLDNGIGDLGRGDDGEGGHHAVGELLTDLGDQQSTHTSTSTTTQRVGDLETLEAVAALGLATDDIQDLVDQLSTLRVVTLGPVVASTGLAENEVVGAEQLTKRTGTDGVHGTGLEIDEDGARNILVAGGLHTQNIERVRRNVWRWWRFAPRGDVGGDVCEHTSLK